MPATRQISIPRGRVGRPRLPEEAKKARVSMTISRNTLALIDSTRGTTPRSTFMESVLEARTTQQVISREHLRRHGIVYTPSLLADFVAKKVVGYALEDSLTGGRSQRCRPRLDRFRVLDPACGDGELLKATWHHLIAQQAHLRDGQSIQLVDPHDVLCGIDTNKNAVNDARELIDALAAEAGFVHERTPKVLGTNALFPYDCRTSAQGWVRVRKQFDAANGFDIVIANPPWGADVSDYRDNLSQGEFSLFQGQYDTADLFIEMALSVVRPGGLIAFIIPDSLFSLERRHLRKLILDRTHIRFVGRFGEKLFEGINRACAVIVCQNVSAATNAKVNCLRLTPDSRKRILSGLSTFPAEEQRSGYSVLQSRFRSNPSFEFDIDVNAEEERVLRCFSLAKSSLGDYLEGSRGVELSKHGRVCQCQMCGSWLPLPSTTSRVCPHCAQPLEVATSRVVSIVQDEESKGSVPLIVGESIGRYLLRQFLWIATDCPGIKYKTKAVYEPPKLLVRKTGVGISAAIDYTNAFTNQVVYIFRNTQKGKKAAMPLEFFLGVLNSRAMYYFLVKRHGETEWRSHPYVTQTQILELPLPERDRLAQNLKVVDEIARLLKPYTRKGTEPPIAVDAGVERLVADLYGLTEEHYRVIYSTLDSVQDLLPIRTLKRVRPIDIFGS